MLRKRGWNPFNFGGVDRKSVVAIPQQGTNSWASRRGRLNCLLRLRRWLRLRSKRGKGTLDLANADRRRSAGGWACWRLVVWGIIGQLRLSLQPPGGDTLEKATALSHLFATTYPPRISFVHAFFHLG